jgi:hypothetical protein
MVAPVRLNVEVVNLSTDAANDCETVAGSDTMVCTFDCNTDAGTLSATEPICANACAFMAAVCAFAAEVAAADTVDDDDDALELEDSPP